MALIDNIISYWKLDETSAGANASDSVGSNTGTNTNTVTYSAGKINNGANFASASSQVLVVGTTTSLKLSSVSVSAWAKTGGDTGWIFSKAGGTGGGGIAYGINLGNYTAGKVCARIKVGSGSSYLDVQATATFNDSIFHFYTLTYDGTTAYLYMDGLQIGTGSGGAIVYNGDYGADIGAEDTTGYHATYFNGMIDELGIWSRALSSTEVTSLYNSGNGFQYPFTTGNKGGFFNFFQ